MKKSSFPRYPTASIAALLALTTKTAEMLLASGHVIRHRTGRMAKAGSNPSARDRREFALMGNEKVEAMMLSSHSIMSTWMTMCNAMAGKFVASQMKVAAAFGALATSRTPIELAARQNKFVSAMAKSPVTPAEVAHSATRLARRGLHPIHSRAVANSKRLRKL